MTEQWVDILGGFLTGCAFACIVIALCLHQPGGRERHEPSEFSAYWGSLNPVVAAIRAFVSSEAAPARGAVVGEVLRLYPDVDRRYVEGMYDALAAQGLVPA